MNRFQQILLACAALIAAGMILYPPWMEYYFADTGQPSKNDRGRHLIWNKPENTPGFKPRGEGVRIYSSRLSGHLMILGIVTFVGYAWLGRKTGDRSSEIEDRR